MPSIWAATEAGEPDLEADAWGAVDVPNQLRRRVSLLRLDAEGSPAIDAIAHLSGPPNGRASRPHLFLASDRHTYWIRHRAQQGLVAELVASRIAAALGVGPACRIIHVSAAAVPSDPSLGEFRGLLVGTRHVVDALNLDDWNKVARSGRQLPGIDARSRAGVIVLHTWINASDEQILVRLSDGRVFSIDHGDCFRALEPGPASRIVVARLAGVSDDLGRDWGLLEPYVRDIEAMTEDDIIRFVSGVPNDDPWRASFDRRLAIARWLIKRQPTLREELLKWAPRLS